MYSPRGNSRKASRVGNGRGRHKGDNVEQLMRPLMSNRGETHVLNKAKMKSFAMEVDRFEKDQAADEKRRSKRMVFRQREIDKTKQLIDRERRGLLRVMARGETLTFDRLAPIQGLVDRCHYLEQVHRVDCMSPTDVEVLREKGAVVMQPRERLTPQKWLDLVVPKTLSIDQIEQFGEQVLDAVDGHEDVPPPIEPLPPKFSRPKRPDSPELYRERVEKFRFGEPAKVEEESDDEHHSPHQRTTRHSKPANSRSSNAPQKPASNASIAAPFRLPPAVPALAVAPPAASPGNGGGKASTYSDRLTVPGAQTARLPRSPSRAGGSTSARGSTALPRATGRPSVLR